jgi:hypothetical protein
MAVNKQRLCQRGNGGFLRVSMVNESLQSAFRAAEGKEWPASFAAVARVKACLKMPLEFGARGQGILNCEIPSV